MRNYQKELTVLLAGQGQLAEKPRLLLHACCAPCLSYVLEYLCPYFALTVLFYNPNIRPSAERERRGAEVARLCSMYQVPLLYPPQAEAEFVTSGMEAQPEGGPRCTACFTLRLGETARRAREGGYAYFTTTLSISPHKNAPLLNAIGEALGLEYGVRHLPADFKKKEGYKRSVALAKQYNLYRQDYCGCMPRSQIMEKDETICQ